MGSGLATDTTMGVKERIERLENSLHTDSPFGPYDVADLALWGYFGVNDGTVPRHQPENPPVELEGMAACAGLGLAVWTLKQPERLRWELEETQRTDEWRREHGYPITVTPDRLQAWEAEIVEAEREAVETRESLGFRMQGFEPEWFERVAREAGLPESVIDLARPCWR
jgi:hypothetical protein